MDATPPKLYVGLLPFFAHITVLVQLPELAETPRSRWNRHVPRRGSPGQAVVRKCYKFGLRLRQLKVIPNAWILKICAYDRPQYIAGNMVAPVLAVVPEVGHMSPTVTEAQARRHPIR
jgi:hypothetical protein